MGLLRFSPTIDEGVSASIPWERVYGSAADSAAIPAPLLGPILSLGHPPCPLLQKAAPLVKNLKQLKKSVETSQHTHRWMSTDPSVNNVSSVQTPWGTF